MKKQIRSYLTMLLMWCIVTVFGFGGSFTTSAQGQEYPMAAPVVNSTTPSVPMHIMSQGYQAVTSYLLKHTKYIRYECVGTSVFNQPGQTERWIDLSNMVGYTPGSFESLANMLQAHGFVAQLVSNTEGQYDARLNIEYITEDGKTALSGNGYMEITQGKGGDLNVSKVEPYVTINWSLASTIKGRVTTAKWLGTWGESADLDVSYNPVKDVSTVIVPAGFLGRGKIGLNVSGQKGSTVTVYDMAGGYSMDGQNAMVVLGKTMSSDVVPVNTLDHIPEYYLDMSKAGYFYKSPVDGKIYGKFPLIDINSPKGGKFTIRIAPEVWGTDGDRAKLELVGLEKLAEGKGGDRFSVTYDKKTGILTFDLSPGCYHVRTWFEEVLDLNSDPNPGKG